MGREKLGFTLYPTLRMDVILSLRIYVMQEELGFTIRQRQTRRIGPKMVTDLDFADDIGLISKTTEQAQTLLEEVERAALQVGLHMNASKTKCMFFNQVQSADIQTLDGSSLEVVNDFKYLGSWIFSSEHDIQVQKALAWKACNGLSKIWKSSFSRSIKEHLGHSMPNEPLGVR